MEQRWRSGNSLSLCLHVFHFPKRRPGSTVLLFLACCSGSPASLPKHLASSAYTHPFLSRILSPAILSLWPHAAVWFCCEPTPFSYLLALLLPALVCYMPQGLITVHSQGPELERRGSLYSLGWRISPSHSALRRPAKLTRSMPEAAPAFLPRIVPLLENTPSWLFLGCLLSLSIFGKLF